MSSKNGTILEKKGIFGFLEQFVIIFYYTSIVNVTFCNIFHQAYT